MDFTKLFKSIASAVIPALVGFGVALFNSKVASQVTFLDIRIDEELEQRILDIAEQAVEHTEEVWRTKPTPEGEAEKKLQHSEKLKAAVRFLQSKAYHLLPTFSFDQAAEYIHTVLGMKRGMKNG